MSVEAETTRDAFFDGRLHVLQPRKGFRAGTDSVLLAAALDQNMTGSALELGCGAGGALIPATWRVPGMHFTGVDRDQAMLELLKQSVSDNKLGDRIDVFSGDAASLPVELNDRFDLVFSNPPFFRDGTIEAPAPGKSGAFLESVSLEDWLKAMLFATRPRGTLILIHRAAELARILAVLDQRAGEIAVLPVRSWPGADAKRVIVRARKGLKRGGTRLLAGIAVHDSKGGPRTGFMESVSREGTGLDWSQH